VKRISSLALAAVLVFSFNSQANEAQPYRSHGKSICGTTDERDLSSEPRVARIRMESAPAGCTVTMIGRTCAVSAGHCHSTFGIAEFNTEPSVDGRIVPSAPEDTYRVDRPSAVYLDRGQGRDWAVVRVLPNEITGAYPGDAQGTFSVSYEMPNVGDVIRITGYGTARGSDRNFAQQTHTGEIASMVRGGSIRHIADTTGGNSGSSIILEASQEIIGIHTHGGCHARGGANSGTLIAGNDDFQDAIRSCLQWEEDNL
jgi:V8-like Glu-specific endopeptidase